MMHAADKVGYVGIYYCSFNHHHVWWTKHKICLCDVMGNLHLIKVYIKKVVNEG
jgi:hypothetical protein